MNEQSAPRVLSEGDEIKHLLQKISKAKSSGEIGLCLEASKFATKLQLYHIGICRLDDVPIKESIFSVEIGATGLSAKTFPDEWKWAICKEGETLMHPFDLLTHEFEVADGSMFTGLRQMATLIGLKQVMIIPLQVQNTITIAIVNFPNGDFDQQAKRVLSEIYQLIFALFERFPMLTKWPDECQLSVREKEVLELTATGLTESLIALKLGISVHTVRNHIQSSKSKLDARSKLHAVAIAIRDREIAPDLPRPEVIA